MDTAVMISNSTFGLPTTAPNIRIIKILPHPTWDQDRIFLMHIITLGYVKFDILKVIFIHIRFCPHCGANLKKYYKSEKYANEIEGVTF